MWRRKADHASLHAHNRPKPQCKRKALSTMHYVYTAAVGQHVVAATGRLLINTIDTRMYLDDPVFHHRELTEMCVL